MQRLDALINDYFFSLPSLILHTIWFVIWFKFHLDVNLLTNIVSLEAIYLSLFIGLAQKSGHQRIKGHIDELTSEQQ